MNRRDFLEPLSQRRPPAPSSPSPFTCAPDAAIESGALLHFSRRAMATSFEFFFPYSQSDAAELANLGFELIDELESQMTVYREDSEIVAINAGAGAGPVAVEPRLFELLQTAAQVSRETSGAFDITAGPLVKVWGFFRRQGRIPKPNQRQEALHRVGMRFVELNPTKHEIRFTRRGMEINLGSIGKGYALDRVAELFRAYGVRSALLHGGGSSVVAVGSEPGSDHGWSVGIRHPDRDARIGIVRLRDQSLGTSAATHQHFVYNNRKYGHILDPRTGWPAEGMASATAVAASGAAADALATAFFVLGVEKTRHYCLTHPGTAAVLLPEGNAPIPLLIGSVPWKPILDRERTSP